MNPSVRQRIELTSDRLPGARGGRLSGQAMSGALFEDGTLLFAARWDASPAGPYTEVFRFEPDGRRCLIVTSARGERIAHWLHGFDATVQTPVEWRTEAWSTTVSWTEQSEAHRLHLPHASHLGFSAASAVLRRLPDRWMLRAGVSKLGARLLGPLLGLGSAPFCGRTETGVPVHLLVRTLRPVLYPSYERAGRSAGDAVPYEGGVPLGELDFTRRAVLADGELFFVPPPPDEAAAPQEPSAPGA